MIPAHSKNLRKHTLITELIDGSIYNHFIKILHNDLYDALYIRVFYGLQV